MVALRLTVRQPRVKTHVSDRWCSKYPDAAAPSYPCLLELGNSDYRPGWKEMKRRHKPQQRLPAHYTCFEEVDWLLCNAR